MPTPSTAESAGSGRKPRLAIALPRQGLPGVAIAVIAMVLALLLFAMLDARRRHAAPNVLSSRSETTNAFLPPPALIVPTEPVPVLTTPVIPAAPKAVRVSPQVAVASPPGAPAQWIAPSPPPSPPSEVIQPHTTESALVVDNGLADSVGNVSSGAAQGTSGALASASDDAAVRTTIIRNRSTIMPIGTMIPAVLETPIDSARPGLVRALVSDDARGFDGRQVLIPRGTRLIGEYQSDIRSGQNRVLVNWTRLLRPDGVAIRIGSPAADSMGGSGIPGHVNSFFFQRFASAVLQSALEVGVNLASRQGNGSVIVTVPGSVGTAGQTLIPSSDLKPKIKVKQGTVMSIFVARDLDFSGAPAIGSPQGATR